MKKEKKPRRPRRVFDIHQRRRLHEIQGLRLRAAEIRRWAASAIADGKREIVVQRDRELTAIAEQIERLGRLAQETGNAVQADITTTPAAEPEPAGTPA